MINKWSDGAIDSAECSFEEPEFIRTQVGHVLVGVLQLGDAN